MDQFGAVGTYVLSALLGAGVGMVFGVVGRPAERWILRLAVITITVVFVIVAFAASRDYPWMGPVYALAAVIVGILVAAHAGRAHPELTGESYPRRVLLVLFHPRLLQPQR